MISKNQHRVCLDLAIIPIVLRSTMVHGKYSRRRFAKCEHVSTCANTSPRIGWRQIRFAFAWSMNRALLLYWIHAPPSVKSWERLAPWRTFLAVSGDAPPEIPSVVYRLDLKTVVFCKLFVEWGLSDYKYIDGLENVSGYFTNFRWRASVIPVFCVVHISDCKHALFFINFFLHTLVCIVRFL